jgi:hypothetical protein
VQDVCRKEKTEETMSLPALARHARPHFVIVPKPDDIDYDCVPANPPPKVSPIEAIRQHEQEEFLAEIYNEQPTYGKLMVRIILLCNPYYWIIR